MRRDVIGACLWSAYAVLWAGGVFTQALAPGMHSAAWAAPAFLFLGCAIVLLYAGAARRWLLASGMAAFGVEVLGVHTGLPFGRYSYTADLQPLIAGVPLAIAAAWITLLAYALAWRRSGPFVCAAVMTVFDLAIDPVAVHALNYWHWEATGPWYAIPLSNFAGWFTVSLALFACSPAQPAGRIPAAVGATVALFFAAVAAAHGLWGPAAVRLLLATAPLTPSAVRKACGTAS